jgi:DNA-directed RNA polymerase specialized sigma24 family protein
MNKGVKMGLDIDKKEMDKSWVNRNTDSKFYEYLYKIASYQVNKKGIPYKDREDFIQFCMFKCLSHQESYNLNKGAAYSFFWKNISLAIIYKQRREARRKNKATTIYVEQEKILDWVENMHFQREGNSFSEIVEENEILNIKKLFSEYNETHKKRKKKIKPSKRNMIRLLKWKSKKEPGYVNNNYTTLKCIFNNWIVSNI